MCLGDAGNGLRGTDFVSSWPSGIHVGASWNKALARQRGAGMGGEFKTKGVNVLLGPVVGPAGRVVLSGRNWEGFSSDPYLSGALAYETVSAVQAAGVITSTKHYIANEQETNRNPSGDVESVSSNIDDRTMHEVYLWPFQDAVHAGSGNIMCSYNRLNNSYGCANSKTLNGLLKTELGFQGWVVSDWGAQHAGVAAALAGLDVAMPSGDAFWGSHLVEAVKNGSVPESRLDDMVTRMLASWYQMSQDKDFPKPGVGMAADITKPHRIVDARNSSFRSTLLDGAVEGHVLVKNVRNALPLKQPKMLSIFGYSAKNPDVNDPTGGLSPWLYGAESFNYTEFGNAFFGESQDFGHTAIAFNGTIYSGGGSGATSQSLAVSPFDALVQQAYDDGTALFWDFVSGAPLVNPASDACLVFGNAYATEAADRPGVRDDFTDGLIKHVADSCNNTIVVLHNAGIRLVDQFVDHPNVTALLFAHLPGEASGRALVDLLYGRANPSGKLPYTVAHNESDYAVLGPDRPAGAFARFPQSNFTEGVLVDYRHFDARNITPRYPFGFGLSYTTFNYSNLTVRTAAGARLDEYPIGEVLEGGPRDLWDVLVNVTAEVANTGGVAGAEVAQLYVGIPAEGAPVRQLRGFEKPFLNASSKATVSFGLTRRDLSVWDVVAQKWRLVRGEYTIEVGGSSRDLPLVGKITI
ncbi:glycoside hydrolase family 3 protein [Thermothielavioides terrestris NRRL 8126]|uniref:Beta-glucosidase cel3A n=1 Tax=Thermothielavioides terrestris (strain ATCC 38088 / NRRL 8126) TaxID=578455 RepID=G2QSH6_THETT|nr:glycoside hydrolase family 3 protein [Thermothielavioides terrestris NRRL 8126]AEO63458.1 glycoside hydrolase family 3 protein [Thermothielavioides terrestris NRRL 8126]